MSINYLYKCKYLYTAPIYILQSLLKNNKMLNKKNSKERSSKKYNTKITSRLRLKALEKNVYIC